MRSHLQLVLRGQFTRDLTLTAGSNVAIVVAGTTGGILAARLLGPEGRGELAAAVVWAGILGTVAQFGLPQAITFYTAQHNAQVSAILQAVLALLVLQSVVMMGVGWLAIGLILGRLQPEAVPETRLYLWSIPPMMLTTYLSTIAQGLRRFDLFGLLRILSAVVYVLAVGLALLLDIHESELVLLFMLAGQACLALGALMFFILRVVRLRPPWTLAWIQPLTNYGAKSYVGSLSWIANARLDQFVMSFMVTLEQLGIYAVAVSYASALYPLLGAFANVLFPRVVGQERRQASRQIYRVLGVTLMVAALSALVFGLGGQLLIPLLFGQNFASAAAPAAVLLIGTIFLSGNYVLSDALRGLGHPLVPSVGEVIGLVITLTGLVLLLPTLGIMGAAWTSLLSYGMVFMFLLFTTRQRLMLPAETISQELDSALDGSQN